MNENNNQFKEICLDIVDSTQIYARKYLENNSTDKCIIIRANQQTCGIGQNDRKWVSPLGNLYTSFIIPLDYNYKLLSSISIITSLSICETIESLGFKPMIKWVNDIMINGKKVSGSLTESIITEKLFIILGIGININMNEENLNEIDQPATSLLIEGNVVVNIELVYNILRDRLFFYLINVEKKELIDKYDKRLAYKNEIVNLIDKKNIEYQGILKGIDENGFVNLDINNEIKTFHDGRLIIKY